MNIYFYTIKPILPNQELLVWYCREFAERLSYPLTGELMLQRIRKEQEYISTGACNQYKKYFFHMILLRFIQSGEVEIYF
jgi:hypothetical protein